MRPGDLQYIHVPKMTIRDHFAARALALMHLERFCPQQAAENAYLIADAMMAEREKARQ